MVADAYIFIYIELLVTRVGSADMFRVRAVGQLLRTARLIYSQKFSRRQLLLLSIAKMFCGGEKISLSGNCHRTVIKKRTVPAEGHDNDTPFLFHDTPPPLSS